MDIQFIHNNKQATDYKDIFFLSIGENKDEKMAKQGMQSSDMAIKIDNCSFLLGMPIIQPF